MAKQRDARTEVPSITSAPEARSDDIARRQRSYLIQMGLRIVCFLAAALTWGRIPWWATLVMVALAVVLPYTAVLVANAGRSRRGGATRVDRPAITGRPPRHIESP